MFNKLLIANRGEIACRIIRTAQSLGIKCVAVYSAADVDALHTQLSDEAYYLGPAASKDSYLCIDKIIAIAKQTKVNAIHPGYGFLAENAEFAKACQAANIIFVGPSVDAINAMGNKSCAKKLMGKAGIPLLPGYHGQEQCPKKLKLIANKIGYPVLLKAAAGGGGKGMRIVQQEKDFIEAFIATQREAKSSFNNDEILIEKYLQNPRHIEIQVFADQYGNCVHLFERDCSIQRRHQKIIEEAPAYAMSAITRDKMGQTAVKAAQAINYVGAGTIEFLMDKKENYYFMEMNTRIQVEHPVTEMICQQDLIAWQLQVAAGKQLPLQQADLKIHGHSIELRIYAEDPANNFLPATGKIHHLTCPELNQHLRLDSGIKIQDCITPYYDPMIAKLIVHAVDREQAIRKLKVALNQYRLIGPKTNIEFLKQVLNHPAFQQTPNIHTGFINEYEADLFATKPQPSQRILALAALYILCKQQHDKTRHGTNDYFSPWKDNNAWRMNLATKQKFNFIHNQQEIELNIEYLTQGYRLHFGQETLDFNGKLTHDTQLTALFNDSNLTAEIIQYDTELHIFTGENYFVLIYKNKTDSDEHAEEIAGQLNAPMPGTIVEILCEVGLEVVAGDKLMIIEAMKMEHTIYAPSTGTIKVVNHKVGDQVNEGEELLAMDGA